MCIRDSAWCVLHNFCKWSGFQLCAAYTSSTAYGTLCTSCHFHQEYLTTTPKCRRKGHYTFLLRPSDAEHATIFFTIYRLLTIDTYIFIKHNRLRRRRQNSILPAPSIHNQSLHCLPIHVTYIKDGWLNIKKGRLHNKDDRLYIKDGRHPTEYRELCTSFKFHQEYAVNKRSRTFRHMHERNHLAK